MSFSLSLLLIHMQRWNHALISNKESSPRYEHFAPFPPVGPAPPPGTCRVQVLRSAAQWSAGLPMAEDSIYKAMIDLITNSKYEISD